MKKLLLLVTILLYTTSSYAADKFMEIHLASKHFNYGKQDYTFNEFNPGIGYIQKFENLADVSIGVYHNSIENVSTYAFIGDSWGNDYIKGGVEIGVVSGYRVLDVLPIMIPHVKFGVKNEKVKIRAIPLVMENEGLTGVVFSLSLEFGIN